MLDDWEPFKWNIQDWENIFENNPLNCRKGKITCSSEPLWERKCSQEFHKFNDILKTSEKVESSGSWLYFDYKYIGKQVDDKNFKSISWRKFGYESLNAKDSTLWIGSTGAHTPCHQDLYGINLVAQIYGTKRWILLPPDMGKYLLPSRVPYEESSCYSKINFSCPKILTSIDEKCKCISVVLSPGDVLYVPHKWWHYVENLSTAISINSWIPISKYDNLSRLNESIVRFLVSSVCSGVSENIQSHLLNPNELFSSNMTAESMKFIEQSLKTIKNEESSSLENMKYIIPSSSDYKFTVLNANQSIKNLQIDTKHHCTNHLPKTIEVNEESDIKEMILNSFCDENVVSQIAINLLKKK
ncbi:HSPB1-associated protein 1 isoform X2 [Daktulosphaira vitifoliae]|nr:HSPB1-associated protein 1 isoform X2 [Daktulosphaira vitifoliae]